MCTHLSCFHNNEKKENDIICQKRKSCWAINSKLLSMFLVLSCVHTYPLDLGLDSSIKRKGNDKRRNKKVTKGVPQRLYFGPSVHDL